MWFIHGKWIQKEDNSEVGSRNQKSYVVHFRAFLEAICFECIDAWEHEVETADQTASMTSYREPAGSIPCPPIAGFPWPSCRTPWPTVKSHLLSHNNDMITLPLREWGNSTVIAIAMVMMSTCGFTVLFNKCKALIRSSVSVELQIASYTCLVSRNCSISAVSTWIVSPVADRHNLGCVTCVRRRPVIILETFTSPIDIRRTLCRRRCIKRSLDADDLMELSCSRSWKIFMSIRWCTLRLASVGVRNGKFLAVVSESSIWLMNESIGCRMHVWISAGTWSGSGSWHSAIWSSAGEVGSSSFWLAVFFSTIHERKFRCRTMA